MMMPDVDMLVELLEAVGMIEPHKAEAVRERLRALREKHAEADPWTTVEAMQPMPVHLRCEVTAYLKQALASRVVVGVILDRRGGSVTRCADRLEAAFRELREWEKGGADGAPVG